MSFNLICAWIARLNDAAARGVNLGICHIAAVANMASLTAATFKEDLEHLIKGAHSVSKQSFEALISSGELPGELFWRKAAITLLPCQHDSALMLFAQLACTKSTLKAYFSCAHPLCLWVPCYLAHFTAA